ncbi:MAG TPA: hypothetical protein PK079_07470 [Leptospiraceae bacterium]|nr:hypothetical protein [Leptospiraceae bacterium]HMW05805.1 hypothetical protein [Leptospiraceae bacterium]HMX34075.1 hypothetical protein [Leptospiraceae bacterium]HMY33914.1 hypothetical protein [Leptospiraceae bacterium]HMZ65851.1 hypothetical protein [Leptospiraceae bacterium]
MDIFEQILKFFGIGEHQAESTIETFHNVPSIITFFQSLYPDARVEKSPEDAEELGIYIQRTGSNQIFIPIRESQKSGYYLIEVPARSHFS